MCSAALHEAAPTDLKTGARMPLVALKAATRLGVLGPPPARPAVEAAPHGRRHSKQRDAEVIRHHYDISNEFYRLVLGPSMTYSCARFVDDSTTLEAAQEAKHDLVCRKLGLHERSGARLLDVGCGWGSMALHAASHYGASVVGVTLSSAQADLARLRVKEAGLEEQIEIRVQDYRDLRGERFDAISSIGMFEHVGAEKMAEYFTTLYALLADTGRLLNHAISSVGGSRMRRNSFIGRFVFPDGELIDVSQVVHAMERAGFEVRDVESLREHYTADAEGLGGEPGSELGGRRGRGGRRTGACLAPLHGGVGQRLRGRRHLAPSGARRQAHARGTERHAADPERLGLIVRSGLPPSQARIRLCKAGPAGAGTQV